MKLELCDEFRIGPARAEEIRLLLAASFPDCEFTQHRNYFKQLPPRRLLAFDGDKLIGHVGLEHRVVATATGPATILGVVDLCVDPATRREGVGTAMLRSVEQLGVEAGIEFLMLFATDSRLYERQQFQRAVNPLRWMKIHEHKTLGIGEEPLEELMIKPIGERSWPDGLVDLLGYQF
ncbi:MAG: GNAT family N-acetyltransferase [Planctomycetota bacterium]|jgi:predicted N-acetyltransferase YhbS